MRPRSRTLLLPLLCVGAAVASAARADEAIKTGGMGAPPSAEAPAGPVATDDQSPQAIGAWAHGVMSGQTAGEAAKPGQPSGCAAAATDGKPHGEVWAGVGTHGYREAGGVVTEPIGSCGQLTIGVSRTQGDLGGRWR